MDILTTSGTYLAYTISYIQLASVTFWIIFIAPWFFKQLKLVKPVKAYSCGFIVTQFDRIVFFYITQLPFHFPWQRYNLSYA